MARQVEACFQYAKQQLLLNTTVHAGEMADSEVADVTSAVLTMGVDRVGKPNRSPNPRRSPAVA